MSIGFSIHTWVMLEQADGDGDGTWNFEPGTK